MEVEYSIYLGQEQKNGFTGFLSEKNFFCVVEIFDGYTSEEGERLMSGLAEIGKTNFGSLVEFDSSVSELIKNLNIPLDTSLAIGYKKNQTLYLKTIATGEVYIGRGRTFEKIIQGNINAAGRWEKDDFYVFTTSFFTQSLKGIIHTKSLLHNHTVMRDFPEHIKQTIGAEDDTGAVALFVKMAEHQETYISNKSGLTIATRIKDYIQKNLQTVGLLDNRKKLVIGIALLLCVGFFGWNITQGIQNKGGIQIGQGQSYNEQKQQIESTLEKATIKVDAVSEGLQLVQEARGNILLLKKIASKDKNEEIVALETKAKDIESTLLKRQVKESQEHYDFGIEEKGAQGIKMYVFEDKAFVLNPEGKVYILALEKKSFEKRKLSNQVNVQSLVAGYEKNAFVLNPTEGIIRIDEEGKNKLIIPKETQWSAIVSMQVYNGNIYLLDGGNNALYKYSVTTDGYGDRVSYFKGSYNDMDKSSTFAIDISVYISHTDTVTKYTAGLRDDFKLTIPGENITLSKIITHTDQKDVYLWDKKNSALYIVTREGNYERQITASLLGQATDVEVYNDKAYLLKGAKLYRIEL